MLIPSIDLMDGKAVQLVQGRKKVLERDNPIDLAKEFNRYGEVAVIDLDAALGNGNNKELIKKICKVADCRVGGGIRDVKLGREYLRAGAKKIIIGTKAKPNFLKNFNKNQIIVAADYKDGYIVIEGWTKKTEIRQSDFIRSLDKYCSEFLITDVSIEGTLAGLNETKIDYLNRLKDITKNKITYAGGIKNIEDIRRLEDININSQLGMGIYTNKIDLQESFISLITFKDKLVPTIVQDEDKQVLQLAYSNMESLKKTFSGKYATYYSRSKNRLWTKGETSGNFQTFVKARFDCDRDAIIFTVSQINAACHSGSYSCFGDKEFNLERLYDLLKKRKESKSRRSYTFQLLKNDKLLLSKLNEEFKELLEAKTKDEIIWESADLLYFLLVKLIKDKISFNDIKQELRGRMK